MAAYLSALTICAISIVLGAAICARRGGWTWAAPAVGLSATMIIALVGVRLPGHVSAAALLLAVAVVASVLSVSRNRVALRQTLTGLPVAAAALAFASLPFIVNERIGELGASQLDDLSFHMGQAEALREIGPGASVTAAGYPTGPHAAVAALAEGLGVDTAAMFTGLLLAVPVLTALTALAAFAGISARLRLAGGLLVGLPYLLASYLAMGAFKEPLLALCFLGFVLTLRDARVASRLTARQAAGLLLTAAGGVAAFGVAGLAWPAGALLWLSVLERSTTWRTLQWAPLARSWRVWALLGGAAAVTCLALIAWSADFFESGPGQFLTERGVGGNFVGQLSPLEALGIWPAADFRYPASEHVLYAPGIALAVAVTLYGAVWCWRGRELVLLSGALAGVSIYAVARPVTLAYFSGKALAVLAPLLTLMGALALYGSSPNRGTGLPRRALWTVVAASFTLLAAYSSALALRGAHVRPHDRGPDLSTFRPIVRGESTLYLGRDNFAGWELRGSENVRGFQSYSSPLAFRLRERGQKEAARPPGAVDSDSVASADLDAYRYLITPRTAYASQPPANFKPIRRSRWHTLWERRGPTPERLILAEGEDPGAVFECRPGAPRLSSDAGTAFVRPKPAVGEAGAWRRPDGSRPDPPGVTETGGSLSQELTLGPGTWEISMRYFSDVPLKLRAGPIVRTLPPYIGDRASLWGVGRIRTAGRRLAVRVDVPSRGPLEVVRRIELGSVAATRVDRKGRVVPLRRACGAYVDWFRLGG